MNKKIFFVNNNIKYTYDDLISDLVKTKNIPEIIIEKDTYKIFLYLIISMITEKEILILDSDLSDREIEKLNINKDCSGKIEVSLDVNSLIKLDTLFDKLLHSTWKLTLFSSGTTGTPKKVVHTLQSLTKFIRISEKRKNDVWGFAYNPTHIAGIQVFLQAFFNQNSIINLFGIEPSKVKKLIETYKITNISATPTFYRLLIGELKGNKFHSVNYITFGGEKFLVDLAEDIRQIFPNAKIKNIYASTEAGSIFISEGENFIVQEEVKNFIKIENNELILHKSLLASIENIKIEGDWFNTGDYVQIISKDPLIITFVGRKSDIINVGGYNVSPLEVEEVICSHPKVVFAKVYGKKNKVTQNIIVADVVSNDDLSEEELKNFLKDKLQVFKIPRIINFVSEIELTRTGKIKR